MSSFSSLTNIARRLQKKKRKLQSLLSTSSQTSESKGEVRPLPRALSDRIPQELFERFIEYLHGDTHSLSRCSIVCWAWLPTSRYHLFGSLVVRPVQLSLGWSLDVNCSVALRGAKYILYGNSRGVYWSEPERKTAPVQVLSLPDVSQIDVLEDHNLLICLSAQRVTTIPLIMLSPTSPKDITSCTIVSSHASFFKIGTQSGRTFVCIVKVRISLHSVFKLMEPIFSMSRSSSELRQYTEFYIPERVTSVDFLKRKIVAGTSNHGFELIDFETLQTQTLSNPRSSFVAFAFLSKNPFKCLAVYGVGDEFLVCYTSYAFYVDSSGYLSPRKCVEWISPIEAIACRDPYILTFSQSHLEVRHMRTGELLQTVWGSYRPLSPSPELFMVQSSGGQVLGLQFGD